MCYSFKSSHLNDVPTFGRSECLSWCLLSRCLASVVVFRAWSKMPGLPRTAPTERRGVAKVNVQKCHLGREATESPKQIVRELRACLQLWFLTADPVLGISPWHQIFPVKYSEQVGGRGGREVRIWGTYFVILDLSLLKAAKKQDQQHVSAGWKWWEDLVAQRAVHSSAAGTAARPWGHNQKYSKTRLWSHSNRHEMNPGTEGQTPSPQLLLYEHVISEVASKVWLQACCHEISAEEQW